MKAPTLIINIGLTLVGLIVLGVMAAPVLEEISRGRAQAFYNAGPVSGVMLYAMMAPVAMMLTSTPQGRIAGLVYAAFNGFALRYAVTSLEGYNYLMGLGTLGLMVVAAVALALYVRRKAAAETRRVADMAELSGKIVHSTTAKLSQTYSGSFYRPNEKDAPIHMVPLAEQLAHGVVWEASSRATVEEFCAKLLSGLADTRDSLKENTVSDPNGYAAAAMDLYIQALEQVFRRQNISYDPEAAGDPKKHMEFHAIRMRAPKAKKKRGAPATPIA